MTETNTTPEQLAEPARQAAGGQPVFPPGRYGRRRESRRAPFNRVAVVVLTIAVVGIGAVAAGVLSQRYGPGRPYDAVVERFYDITDDRVVVEFSVVVPDGETAICAVRARNADGAEVGREQVRISAAGDSPTGDSLIGDPRTGDSPTGGPRTWVSHTLATNDRAVTGEVQRCWRDE